MSEVSESPYKPDFVCPRDHGELVYRETALQCRSCGFLYPISRGIPVFICDERSVFASADYQCQHHNSGVDTTSNGTLGAIRRLERRLATFLGNCTSSLKRPWYTDVARELLEHKARIRVLAIGAGGRSYSYPGADVVCTDVAFGPHIRAIVDAHDLPFLEETFDLVVAVAVLEHVADPQRCVSEIWRVLKADGVVFAATPFMQPVHMGAHDFTRFTPMGHRRLFRAFDTMHEGIAMGAGSMLAFAITGFLVSVSQLATYRRVAGLVGALLTVPLRKLDRWMSPVVSRDNAAGCYFVGRKRTTRIPDRDLIRQYSGGFRPSL